MEDYDINSTETAEELCCQMRCTVSQCGQAPLIAMYACKDTNERPLWAVCKRNLIGLALVEVISA